MRRPFLFLLLAVLCLTQSAAFAQSTPNAAFIELFNLLPAPTEDMLSEDIPLDTVSYLDLAAMRAAAPDVDMFDRDTLLNHYGMVNYWISDLFRAVREGMETVTGIAPDTIDQIMTFGDPPAQLIVLQGDFNAEAIGDAYAELGFDVRVGADMTTICPSRGCDEAGRLNLVNRNVANPFGGDIGREESIRIIERGGERADLILASPNNSLVEAAVGQISGDELSLISLDMVQAGQLLTASADGQTLAAAQFLNPLRIGTADDLEPQLPVYDRLAIGSYLGGNLPSRTLVGLVYADGASARDLASVLSDRLLLASTVDPSRTYADLFEREEVSVGESEYVPLGMGWGALTLEFSAPDVRHEALNTIQEMIQRRDALWLTP